LNNAPCPLPPCPCPLQATESGKRIRLAPPAPSRGFANGIASDPVIAALSRTRESGSKSSASLRGAGYRARNVATAKHLRPGDPAFGVLPAAPSGGNIGRFLNQEAVDRLILAHDAGWSYAQLVDLYDGFRLQIQRASPGWIADRASCSDGSTAFVGALPGVANRVLVVMPDRSMFLGSLGATQVDGLLSYSGMTFTPTGTVQFPAPNAAAPRTTRLR